MKKLNQRLNTGDKVIDKTRENLGVGIIKEIHMGGFCSVRFDTTFQRLHIESLVRSELFEREKNIIKQRKQEAIDYLRSVLKNDFISAGKDFENKYKNCIGLDVYDKEKLSFVAAWFKDNLPESESTFQMPDEEQIKAISAVDGHIQVVARAGSGKTSTLVNRAFFLIKHCGISPNELLLLAFNKSATLEMRKRLELLLKSPPPHVMTFHALAYALVHPDEDLLFDDQAADSLGLSREIQRVIDGHLRSDRYRGMIRDVMLANFLEDWERIVDGGFHLSIPELIEYRSSLPRETLKGDYVKSFGERLIANTLFQNDIEYKYERNFRWGDTNYKPDFTILLPDGRKVIIEYFGLAGDPDYDEMSEEKRKFWKNREGSIFLEFTPTDIASRDIAGFQVLLLEALEAAGVTNRRLDEEEIWQRIQDRAIDRFTSAMNSFVGRCRKNNLTLDELRVHVEQHVPLGESERLFLEVGISIYKGYLALLQNPETPSEDFSGLLWRAVHLLADGQSRFARDRGRERGDIRNLRYVVVDEFQDFSPMFYALSEGIRSLNPKVEFFCVGDNWQAINGFAGSDLRYFEDFKGHFGENSTILNVCTNYRSAAEIVQLGNVLMHGKGKPATPSRSDSGKVVTACLGEFKPSPGEQARHQGDETTPAILRLLKKELDSGHDVVLLSRRNRVPGHVNYAPDLLRSPDGLERFIEHIRSFLPEEDRRRVTISTAHKYKGGQKGAVIVLDADEGAYPLIHPTWMFLRVFGDSIERIKAEEQRLFYVALTRAEHSLVILSDNKAQESPYLKEIRQRKDLNPIRWQNLPPIQSLDSPRLEVRVLNAYEVREQLKAIGYRWNQRRRTWERSVLAEGFDFKALCEQSWATGNVRIGIFGEDGALIEQWCANSVISPSSASGGELALPPKRAKTGLINDTPPLLLERLRTLRKKIADSEGVAPHNVFNDPSLVEMVEKLPTDKDAFWQINGVNILKLQRYAQFFIKEIVDCLERR